ncbi:MAG: ABC transporter substrate-binding protein [Magnetococcales bacterium]|nr:ABC transporter substrate-binding protein [Magnetococcales bacterium]
MSNRKGVMVFLVAWFFLSLGSPAMAETFSVGVALPLSGEKKDRGEKILHALEMKVEAINASGQMGVHTLDLQVRDDQSDPETGKAIATEFAANPRVLGVIGHYDSHIAIPAAEIYNKEKLLIISPAVGATAFLDKGEYGFSATFADTHQGADIASFLKLMANIKSVLVIHGTGGYARTVKNAFAERAQRDDMTIRTLEVSDAHQQLPEDFIKTQYPANQVFDAILIVDKSDRGRQLIRQVRDAGIATPIYATDRTSTDMIEKLELKYKKNLFVSLPFLFDFASMQAYEFQKEYARRFQSQPSEWAAFAYDALGMIAEAIQKKADRESVMRAIADQNDVEKAYEGITGKCYFGAHRSAQRSLVVVRFSAEGDLLKPLHDQIRQVSESEVLRHLDKKVASGEVLLSDKVPYYHVRVILVGIDFLRLNDVDVKEGTFNLDFFLWYRWKGDFDIDNIVLTNATDSDKGPLSLVELRNDLEAEIKWQSYQGRGTFLAPFDLHQWPFDLQKLPIMVAHKYKNANKVQFLVDKERIRSQSFSDVPDEWEYLGRQDAGGTYYLDSVFGNPNYRASEKQPAFSMVQTDLDVKRNTFPYLINLFVPLAVVVLISLFAALVPSDKFDIKLNMAMTGILTVVVFQLTQVGSLPPLGYPTVGDIYFMLSYVFLFILTIKNFIMMRLFDRAEKMGGSVKYDSLVDFGFVVLSLVVYGTYTYLVIPK